MIEAQQGISMWKNHSKSKSNLHFFKYKISNKYIKFCRKNKEKNNVASYQLLIIKAKAP